MIFPPTLLRFRIRKPGRRRLGLWIPIVLLWPLMLVGALLISVLGTLRALLAGRWRRLGRAALLGPRLLLLSCRFRGLRIDVRDERRELLITIV